jgi:hypothetical protein
MLLGFGIPVLLARAEIHHMDYVGYFGPGSVKEEVVRLDVTVDEILFVD